MFDLKKGAEKDATPAQKNGTPTGEAHDEATALPHSESPEVKVDLTALQPVSLEESVDLTTPPQRLNIPPEKSSRLPEMQTPGRGQPDQPLNDDARKLVIGREIVLKGEINSCDLVVVEGRVEATMKDCLEIKITETGTFKGHVEFERADISGVFEGELTAREHLVVRGTGRVTGKVRFGELEIERGGQVIGDIQVFGAGAGQHAQGAVDKQAR